MDICHICNSERLIPLDSKLLKKQVTSDCKPIEVPVNFLFCRKCHCLQKKITPAWEKTVDSIYHSYSLYYQGEGSEQLVFINGKSMPRSHRIVDALNKQIALPTKGHLLDIGCGKGSFLHSFNQYRPEWTMSGSETNDNDRNLIESISGFERLWCCSPKDISGTFDLISMIHVLEHIISPVLFLTEVRERLSEDGLLVIETPNFKQNPFDLVIVDHVTHFTLETLCDVIEHAGFEIIWKNDAWVPKELTVLAKKSSSDKGRNNHVSYADENDIRKYLHWLEQLRSRSVSLTNVVPLGIFGTSISATWLFSEIPECEIFFVDEDPLRVGKTHFGHPVFDPEHIPFKSTIILPFCSNLAHNIKKRLELYNKSLTIITPD